MSASRLIVIIVTLFLLPDKAIASDSANYYLDKSNEHLNDFKYNDAIYFVDLSIKYNLKNESNPLKQYLHKGNIYKQKGLLDSALFFMNKATFDIAEDKPYYANVLLQKGRILKTKGNYPEALNNLKQALVIYENLNDRAHIGTVKLNIGNIFKSLEKYKMAKEYYYNALAIFNELNLEQKMASCYNNLGNLYRKTGDIDSSFHYLYKTLELRKKSDNIRHVSFVYHNLAVLHEKLGNIDSSLHYINQSLQLKFKVGNQSEIYIDYFSLGDIYAMQKDYKNSIYYYGEALIASKAQNNLEITSNLSKVLGKSYFELEDYEASSKYYNDYVIFSDSLKSYRNLSKLEFELINYEIVRDSLSKNQLLLKQEIAKREKSNLELKRTINKNNITYLFLILIIVILLGGALYISFKKRLRESNINKKKLEKQNKELKRTLISKEEKETLLKEIHHRVKNNLQIINSLIRLQSHHMTANNFREKLNETENRIRSMALVHEKLYKSEELSRLNANTYIKELATNILDTFQSTTPIRLEFKLEDIQYNIDTLIPLGLIINEVISNSIKYAFTDRKSGNILLQLDYNHEKKITLFRISDNGIGADLTYNELSEDSLGMELIKSLCEQLDGEIKLETTTGFDYFFTFPELK